MPLPGCKITYLVERPTAFIKITGRAAVEGARGFRELVERLHAEGNPQVCLDLSECLLMDSTFSGVLAHLSSRLGARTETDCPRFVLYKPNHRIRDLLDSLGVLALVTIMEDPHLPDRENLTEAELGGASKREVAECCLEAHRILMALRPENVAKFQELTRVLERQMEAPPSP